MVHPTYGAVKLPKINTETNLWQFRSAPTAVKRREGKEGARGGGRGREREGRERGGRGEMFVKEVSGVSKRAKVTGYRVSRDRAEK